METSILTLSLTKKHLYGLGPVEYLKGEIMIIDGRTYRSTAISGSEIKVEETSNIKAPFFGYAHINNWVEKKLPESVQTIIDLEHYLSKQTTSYNRPFIFKLTGTFDESTIHIVNLPEGTKVNSPKDAHKGRKDYMLKNSQFDVVGFFSKEHQSILTHHDTFLHMHLITSDRKKMGHLDHVLFRKGTVRLFLPLE